MSPKLQDGLQADGLVFITYSDSQDGRAHDSQTRQLVRKKAYNAYRTREYRGLKGIQRPRPIKQGISRFRVRKHLQTKGLNGLVQAEKPKSLSPFEPMLKNLGGDAWDILKYYHYRFRQNSAAINVEGDWLSFTMSNVAIAHAQLALIALNMELDSSVLQSSASLRHASAAIRLVRNALEDDSRTLDDTLVGAIALLTIVESMQDDQISSTVHLNGLNKVISLRGGFGAFSRLKVLQRVIAWSRRSYCLRWYDVLSLPPLPSPSQPEFDELHQRNEDLTASMEKLTTNDEYAGIISRELIDVLEGFQAIASYPSQSLRTKSQRLHISQAILDVEYKLMLLHQDHLSGLAGLSSSFTTLSKPFQLAAQLYVLLILRQLPARSSVVQKYAEPLAAGLQSNSLGRSSSERLRSSEWHKISIWVLVLLLVATADSESRQRHVSCLSSSIEAMAVEDLQHFVRSLRDVAWMDGLLEEEVAVIWSGIGTRRK